MKIKLALFAIVSFAWAFICLTLLSPATTVIRSSTAVATAENSNAAWVAQQAVESVSAIPMMLPPIILLAALLFLKDIARGVAFGLAFLRKDMGPDSRRFVGALLVLFVFGLTGCVRLRELEVETKRVEKWNGITPSTLIEGHPSGMNMFIQPK